MTADGRAGRAGGRLDPAPSGAGPRARPGARSGAAPDWYRDAVIYEVHVRAFHDSNGDGIGDFRGLTEKLDYLVDLGVTALWLLPFFPSPGRDDGYDTSDYRGVHPDYGTMADVRAFLAAAHRRGLRVIGELVLNHTSDQHPWFQRARRARAGSPRRDWYVWSDDPGAYGDARIIFRDFETSNWTWDPVAGAYYWHRFYSHQPDLNYENPGVRAEMLATVDHWLDLGIDGLRLDAVPYLYEEEGTSCENLPATHAFLRELRRHVDDRYRDRLLLAEANQWPEDAVAYFGAGRGDECHMAFHFPLMPRMFMALRTEDRFPIVDILEQTPPIPETAQWAIFLRNHDELTLEMVTDEERDYLYGAYASDPAARINLGIRRRLAPLVGTRRRLELLFGLLFSLPGTPVLYYGDEIGMGDNYFLGDRDAVRTPMQWSSDRNAGFSEANRQRLYLPLIVDPEYHFEAVNVAAQEANPASFLWWMRRVIGIRRRHPALARGDLRLLPTTNPRVLAYLRSHGDESILAVVNLSRHAQWCELDLASEAGRRVVELFGGAEFPAVTRDPYRLTLGPHTFLWFRLETPESGPEGAGEIEVSLDAPLEALLRAAGGRGSPLSRALARHLDGERAYHLLGPVAASTRVVHAEPIELPGRRVALALVAVDTRAGDVATVPLALELVRSAGGERRATQGVVARFRHAGSGRSRDALVDASRDPAVERILADLALGRPGAGRGRLRGRPVALARLRRDPRPGATEPVARLTGRVEPAPAPELAAARRLAGRHAPVEPLLASLELVLDGRPLTVGLVTPGRHPGAATLADEAAGSLDRLVEAALATRAFPANIAFGAATVVGPVPEAATPGPAWDDPVARELSDVESLGRSAGACLAGLHDALAAPGMPAEPYAAMDRRALYQEGRTLLGAVAAALGAPPSSAGLAPGGTGVTTPQDDHDEGAAGPGRPRERAVVAVRAALDGRLRGIVDRRVGACESRGTARRSTRRASSAATPGAMSSSPRSSIGTARPSGPGPARPWLTSRPCSARSR